MPDTRDTTALPQVDEPRTDSDSPEARDPVRPAPPQLAALAQRIEQRSGRDYWRTLDELAETGEFQDYLQREFPENAAEWTGASRRSFLKRMGASLALAGVTGCDIRQPREQILPYVHTPETLVPGLPLYFCTSWELSGNGVGLTVESRMGRPIKVEGNPRHPASRGATGVFAQAATLDLYDPDRPRAPSRGGRVTTLEAVREHLAASRPDWDASDGRGLRILSRPTGSPTFHRMIGQLIQRWPQAKWHTFQPVARDHVTAGQRLAWGEEAATAEPVYRFDRASVVVSIGADFLAARDAPPSWITDFASARRVAGRPDDRDPAQPPEHTLRLHAVTSTPTLTAAKADHRLTLAPPRIPDALLWLARRLDVDVGSIDRASRLSGEQTQWLERCAGDLQQPPGGAGTALVVAGDEQPPAVHALVHAINEKLGAAGHTVDWVDRRSSSPDAPSPPADSVDSLKQLTEEMRSGQVDTLLILDGNPVFDAPADLRFTEALAGVPDSLHLSGSVNETSVRCQWHVPQSHFLESWGDTRSADGTAAITQPLVEPLHASVTPIELVGQMVAASGDSVAAIADGYALVRQTWQQRQEDGDESDFESRWRRWLRRGVIDPVDAGAGNGDRRNAPSEPSGDQQTSPGDQQAPGAGSGVAVSLRADFAERIAEALEPAADSDGSSGSPPSDQAGRFHLLFRPDPTIWDGRFANNGWLQELPKPLTKLTWDNALLVSLGDAQRLQVTSGDLVRVGRGERQATLPVWVIPGQAEGTLTAFFGYGRRRSGRVAAGTGFDVYPLRTSDAMWTAGDVTVTKLDRQYPLASTQHHHLMEGKHLVRSGSLEELKKEPEQPEFAHPGRQSPKESFYEPWPEDSPQWGMTIDLTACTGCSACVIACQAENNIPVVGKEEVHRNREMHWIRVDTYYGGPAKEPESTHHQPVPCMHCELAPCEVVCPVVATAHSEDGLNQMIYNRCVGTRYCSNNCPYKVRRFNFFDYGGRFFDTPGEHLLANPEVTVRSSGVMEKCTYCVQRIKAAQAEAELEDRKLRDGEVVTACQSVCPARAIEFGDLSDSRSEVHHRHHHPLNYELLGELNTRPRTTYLAEIHNPLP